MTEGRAITKRLVSFACLLSLVLTVVIAPAVAPQRAAGMTLAEGTSVSGDFRGNGRSQIATLYDPGDDLGLRISMLDRSGGASSTGAPDAFVQTTWLVSGPNSFDLGRMKVAATDVDFDGKTDLVALYDDGGTSVRLLVFRSTGSGFTYAGAWWQSDGYAWSRTKAVLSGNFSAVGRNGLLFVYQYDSFQMRIHYLESDGAKFIYNGNNGVYDSGPGQYDTARARFAIGRFTRSSGPDQLASIYGYDNYRIRIHVFDPTPTGLQPVNGWAGLYDSGENQFDLSRMKVVAGDIDGDGRSDLATLYGYPDGSARVQLFSGAANLALTSGAVGIAYLAPGSVTFGPARLVAGDWDGDRRFDLATLTPNVDGTTHAAILRSDGRTLTYTADAWVTPAAEAVRVACALECWPLNGMPVAGGPVKRRPLSVRIDNAPQARPHYGTSEADMMWEFLVEGLVTRLNAVYQQGNPGTIGPVRSARLSDRYLTPMLRGVLAYSGSTIEETNLIRFDSRDHRYIDLDANLFGVTYYRTPTRVSPYNVFTSSDLLRAAAGTVPGGNDPVDVPRWAFLKNLDHQPNAGGFSGSVAATTLTIPYRSRSTVRYQYDAATRSYGRWQDNGQDVMVREVDAANNVTIAARNIIVIQTDVFVANPPILEDITGALGWDMRMTGTGSASIFRDGKRQDGTWSRATIYDAFTFTNRSGDVVYLSPGQTWFHVVPTDWTIPSS